jgi:cell division protein FtsB
VKALTLIFVALIALLQYPLWLGKGSWLRVWNVNQQIDEQKDKNTAFKQRNETLNAEVHDLKQGNAAIEERARTELGMIKQDEVFYQVIDQALPAKPENQLPVNQVPAVSDTTSNTSSTSTNLVKTPKTNP